MSMDSDATNDWQSAFLPLGCTDDNGWQPLGGGVLLLDRPVVWLVTSRRVIESSGDRHIATWVPSEHGPGLLDITDSQQRSDVAWLHHATGISATLFPLSESFQVKAFTETQCTKLRDLQPLQPTASVGAMYGVGGDHSTQPKTAVCDGTISATNSATGRIISTAPMLPRNAGSPLVLASPYGGAVTLAGILIGNTILPESDPRMLPIRLSEAVCVDAAFELVRSPAATEQRKRVIGQASKQGESSKQGDGASE